MKSFPFAHLALTALLVMLTGCIKETPQTHNGPINMHRVSFSASCPGSETKIDIQEDSPLISWTGGETATVLIGESGVTASREAGLQIGLPSTDKGCFEGEINLGSGKGGALYTVTPVLKCKF